MKHFGGKVTNSIHTWELQNPHDIIENERNSPKSSIISIQDNLTRDKFREIINEDSKQEGAQD
ncbi:hypothetical protein J6590_046432 [Homalodisca vitripennis]|nr:hypothetical protein J6590_046432 [Homalodisca vitripennis]